MIRTSTLVPEIYNTSYDFTIFEAVMDIVFNAADSKIWAVQGLHSPRDCFEENLSGLASLFNLESTNRLLLEKFRMMLRGRGSKDAIQSALVCCGATDFKQVPSDDGNVVYNIVGESFAFDLFDSLMEKLLPADIVIQVNRMESLTE